MAPKKKPPKKPARKKPSPPVRDEVSVELIKILDGAVKTQVTAQNAAHVLRAVIADAEDGQRRLNSVAASVMTTVELLRQGR